MKLNSVLKRFGAWITLLDMETDTTIAPLCPFSTIGVADLAGLRAVVPQELGINGPHKVGWLLDMAAFEEPTLATGQTNVRYRIDIRDALSKNAQGVQQNVLRAFVDSDTDVEDLLDRELKTPYSKSLVRDILALDHALGYARSDWFMLYDQKTGIKPGEKHRAPYWHLDKVGQRIYVVASCLGTLAVKDSAPKHIVDGLRFDTKNSERTARTENLLMEFEAGCVYLMSPSTWHRGQLAPANAQPFDRTFLGIGVSSPR